MNTVTSLRSIKSVRSTKSDKSTRIAADESEIDFEEYIVTGCKRFNCPVDVAVIKENQRDIMLKPQKSREAGNTRSRRIDITTPVVQEIEPSSSVKYTNKEQLEMEEPDTLHTIEIIASYDSYHRITEIYISKFRLQPLPRIMMQLIGHVLPYYSQLTKFTIRSCYIDQYTLHELGKVFPYSTITDVSLDGCPLPQGNYDLLLGNASKIRNLSLCRCRINDVVCERLSSRLIFMEPAEENLVTLNLSSNHITDVGAKYIADALRSNRHLRYLNLADNRISDEGAMKIFNVLLEFPLTYDEIMEKRHRFMLYLQKKRTMILECLLKLGARPSVDQLVMKKPNSLPKKPSTGEASRKSKGSIKKEKLKSQISDNNLLLKAEMITKDLLGLFKDPFSQENIRIDNGYAFCLGNLVLCYLNLAYNNLTYVSIEKLLSVVEYQQAFKELPMSGLFKVIVDGNYLPNGCAELTLINNILNKHIADCSKQIFERSKKSLIDKKLVPKRQ